MNDYILSVLLGIVEGLTEFLPVSSTAHLRLVEAMLHVDLASPYWKMYTIVIQLGAILALVLLFTGRILEFFRTFPRGRKRGPYGPHPPSFPDPGGLCLHRGSVVVAGQVDRQASGKPSPDGLGAADWRRRDVAGGCLECASRSEDQRCGADDPLPGGLDRAVGGHVGCVSRRLAIDVDHRRRSGRGHDAHRRPRVQLSLVHPGHDCGNRLRISPHHPSQACPGWRSDRPPGHDHAWLDRAGHRLCGFLYRCLGGGRVVPAVGATPRVSSSLRSIASSWAHCCWPSAPNLQEPD